MMLGSACMSPVNAVLGVCCKDCSNASHHHPRYFRCNFFWPSNGSTFAVPIAAGQEASALIARLIE